MLQKKEGRKALLDNSETGGTAVLTSPTFNFIWFVHRPLPVEEKATDGRSGGHDRKRKSKRARIRRYLGLLEPAPAVFTVVLDDQATAARSLFVDAVPEIAEPTPLAVTGRVPAWLRGTWLRNGPGQYFAGAQRHQHMSRRELALMVTFQARM